MQRSTKPKSRPTQTTVENLTGIIWDSVLIDANLSELIDRIRMCDLPATPSVVDNLEKCRRIVRFALRKIDDDVTKAVQSFEKTKAATV